MKGIKVAEPRHKILDIESPMAIELRRIMIRLNRELDFDRKRCVLITSAERGEGKSLFALNFSLVLASHMKKNILLVDGDMRRPVQHSAFDVPITPGLSDVLSGSVDSVKPVKTYMDNLDFLPAGTMADQPSHLLDTQKLETVFGQYKGDYDIVILDCPPVVPVSDTLLFNEIADGILYLVMAGRTPSVLAKRGVDILKGVGANIIGVVANNLAEVLPYFYGHKHYGYGGKKK
ncbi:CpsD/CapB family tyrosine-protein kinase [bacterium]|jgi:capsular exopolysaccharide synthesis family protein|nr:CpsD/CapB family tyrosine-protein kinase [bacterium]MBT7310926.1 CpsD/CapB family tyrosine-protein kinase [bacterium]